MKKYKYWFIKERINPQFDNSYYVALGNMPNNKAKRHEESLYGMTIVRRYDTEEKYNKEIEKLKAAQFSVHQSL
jgi:hypothetical protein